MRQALLIIIWQLSAILLLTSSPFKLCQVGWGQTHFFRFLQKYLIGFKLRLSCWKVNLLPSRRFWMPWCIKLFFYSDESFSPCRWKTTPQHETATITLYFWDGTLQVMSSAWFPSNMMLRLEVHQTRESCFFQSEGPLGAFLLIPSVFSCVFIEERIEFRHTAIKPRSVEWCSDVCPSVSFSNLHIWSWSSTRVTIRLLVTTLTKALLHQLLSLARRPALGRILVVSNFFH